MSGALLISSATTQFLVRDTNDRRVIEDVRALLAEECQGREIHAFTDGGADPNPGAGGWGVACYVDGTCVARLCGGEPSTTNNRMELTAAIMAVSCSPAVPLVVHSDSKYVVDGITLWCPGWKRTSWRIGGKSPVKNIDLWQRLDSAHQRVRPAWRWVRGHAGLAGNEEADRLATAGRHAATSFSQATISEAASSR